MIFCFCGLSEMHQARRAQLSSSWGITVQIQGHPSAVLNKSTLVVGFQSNVINADSSAHRLSLQTNHSFRNVNRDLICPNKSQISRDLHFTHSASLPSNPPNLTPLRSLSLSYPIHYSPCYHKWFYSQPQWIVEGCCLISFSCVFWVMPQWYFLCAFQDLFLASCRGIKATRDHGYEVYSNFFLWLADKCNHVCVVSLPRLNCGRKGLRCMKFRGLCSSRVAKHNKHFNTARLFLHARYLEKQMQNLLNVG